MNIAPLEAGLWRLAEQTPALFTMIVFYRGYFCGSCRDYLMALHARLAEFHARGVAPIAVSMDTRDHARAAFDEWGLNGLPIGYGLAESAAEAWSLFVTGHGNPLRPEAVFSEPGLFLIRPDQSIYAVFVQSSEFARPRFEQILTAIDFLGD